MNPHTLASITGEFLRDKHAGRAAVLLAAEQRIIFLEQLIMGKEANIISHLQAENADLKAKLAAVPPPTDPALIKDQADIAAEAGFNADGTEVTPPPATPA